MNKYNNSNRGYKPVRYSNVNNSRSKAKSNNKSTSKRKNKTKISSILVTVLVVLALLACVGGAVHLFKGKVNNTPVTDVTGTQVVYFVPGDDWSSDGSNIGAWCWNGSSMPASSFVLGTDTNDDGIWEFEISKNYTGLLFVDLKPEATQLGLNWEYVRAQTLDLVVPTGENIYYHQYVNEWSATSDMMFYVTTEEVVVFFDGTIDSDALPEAYVIDKTGINEEKKLSLNSDENNVLFATVPAGYTHIVFVGVYEDPYQSGWKAQSEELPIPTGEFNYYHYATNSWTVYTIE